MFWYANAEMKAGGAWRCRYKYKDSADKAAHAYRLRRYGLTIEDYDAMLLTQKGRCAICGRSATENTKRLSVDHDHVTGHVRGLLCQVCNRDVGRIEKYEKQVRRYLGWD